MNSAYIATIQVVIDPDAAKSEAEACDWISGLLSENTQVLDWQYLKVGGQPLIPQEIHVQHKQYYLEGDAFR